jgi:hypothetical protein
MRGMTEREQEQGTLEQKFSALEAKCVDAIRTEWPEGAGCEMGVSEDDSYILILGDDGVWYSYRNTYPELDSDLDALIGLSKSERTFKLEEIQLKGDRLDEFDNKYFCHNLGKKPSLDALLMAQAALDNGLRARVREQGKKDENKALNMMTDYVDENRKNLAEELMESMKDLLEGIESQHRTEQASQIRP